MISKTTNILLGLTLAAAPVAAVCQADEQCKPVNRDASISRVLNDHAGSKVLKVDEREGADGCTDLEIRILIDGTVKAIVVKGQKSA
jgi:hypothetical protein